MKNKLLVLIIGASFMILLVSVGFLIHLKRLHSSLSYIQAVGQYVQQGKLDEAIVLLTDTLNKNPRNAEAHAALGMIYNKKDLCDDALSEFKTALSIKPDLFVIYQEMYLAYKKKGMEDEAKSALDSYERLRGAR